MKLNQIIFIRPPPTMSYRKEKAVAVITGLERPVNDHLLKFISVQRSDDAVRWKTELFVGLEEIGEIRIRPDGKPGQAFMYYGILFDEPFGGTEERNVTSRLCRLARTGYALRADLETSEVVVLLRDFHLKFADLCELGKANTTSITTLLAEFSKAAGCNIAR